MVLSFAVCFTFVCVVCDRCLCIAYDLLIVLVLFAYCLGWLVWLWFLLLVLGYCCLFIVLCCGVGCWFWVLGGLIVITDAGVFCNIELVCGFVHGMCFCLWFG